MKNKDYREVQLTSSQLVFIFLGILVLGVVIFLLGVSVGKKQAEIERESGLETQAKLDQPKNKDSLPSTKPKDSIDKELASHQKMRAKRKRNLRKPGKRDFILTRLVLLIPERKLPPLQTNSRKKAIPLWCWTLYRQIEVQFFG